MHTTNTDAFPLNLAPTGMMPKKRDCPHVPITPEEIISDVLKCIEIGVTTIHLHARDENGQPTNNRYTYEKIIGGIREHHEDAVICVTCSGRIDQEFEARSTVLNIDGDLKPDMASLTTSSLNFQDNASVNQPDTVKRLAEMMIERGIKPEIEVFDIGMVNYANYMISKNLLEPPFYFNVILGNIASAQVNMTHIAAILNELPEKSIWSLGGIGRSQLNANILALTQGGGVRIGLEDNIWLDQKREQLATNSSLVKRIVNFGNILERQVMKPSEFRSAMKMSR